MGPVGQYQVPESVGKGNIRVGIAGGGAYRVNKDLNGEDYWGATSDLWIDYGIGKRSDFRIRLSNLMYFDSQPGGDVPSFDILGIDLQLKFSNSTGTMAFLVGSQPQLIIDPVGDETHVDFAGPLVYSGGVFGLGEPRGIRFVFTPTLAAGFGRAFFNKPVFWFQLAASSGLVIPIFDIFSLRPELAIHYTQLFLGEDGAAVLTFTFGMALVF